MEEIVKLLQKQVAQQALMIAELQQEIILLKEMNAQLRMQRFGSKSDRVDAIARQANLFDEAEAVLDQGPAIEEPIEIPVAAHKRGGRRKLPKALPRICPVPAEPAQMWHKVPGPAYAPAWGDSQPDGHQVSGIKSEVEERREVAKEFRWQVLRLIDNPYRQHLFILTHLRQRKPKNS